MTRAENTLFIIFLVILAIFIDFLTKRASLHTSPFSTWEFYVAILFGILALTGWVFAMRYETLAGIGVLEASVSLLGLFLLSLFVYSEAVKPATFLSAILAITAVAIHAGWGGE